MAKKINYELIAEEHEAYRVLSKMRLHHPDVSDADIGLAWQKQLKPDVDGHLVLGKCVKLSDLHREFFKLDFIIVLNKEIWNDREFTAKQKEALIDHELCHAAAVEGEDGPQRDERDRGVWRIRKHDIEEFQEIVQRHGCYKKDLERFAETIIRKRKTPLFAEEKESSKEAVQ